MLLAVLSKFSTLSLSSALAVASCLLLSSKSFVRESCLAFLSEQQLKVPDYLSAGYYVSLASVQHPALELLNHSSLDILPPLTSTVFSHLAESVMSTLSLAQVIRNAGYSATASIEDFQQLLLRFQPLRENDVSTIIATMSFQRYVGFLIFMTSHLVGPYPLGTKLFAAELFLQSCRAKLLELGSRFGINGHSGAIFCY